MVDFIDLRKNILNKPCIPEINSTQYIINGDLANVVKLRILKWGDYPRLSGWGQIYHKNLQVWKREAENRESYGSVRTTVLDVAGFEVQRMRPQTKEYGWFLEAGKRRETFSSRTSKRN